MLEFLFFLLDEDEMAMQFSGGPKSLKVYGFVPQSQVKVEYWTGKGSRVVVPQSEVKNIYINIYYIKFRSN